MELSELTHAVSRRNETAVKRLLERDASGETVKDFQTYLDKMIQFYSRHIPTRPSMQLVKSFGVHGHKSPPERRMEAIDYLHERPTNPTREDEELKAVGPPERLVQTATIHFVTEVNAASLANPKEAKKILLLLDWIQSAVTRKDVVISPTDENPDIVRVKKTTGVLHLIQRGVVGNYNYSKLALENQGLISHAREIYMRSTEAVFGRVADFSPSDDIVAHKFLEEDIAKAIEIDRGIDRISVPVLVNPQVYVTRKMGSERKTVTPPRATSEQPVILMIPNGNTGFLNLT